MSTTERIIERDLQQHIEDSPLYTLFRNGCAMKLTWNELTDTEKAHQREAQRRAEYVALFAPCGGEQW